MTTFFAKVLADSISPEDCQITTLQLRYPRFIHAEFMTHRAFSRNASSSRAIPVQRLIKDALDDPAVPIFWGRNQPGMQAGEEHAELVLLGAWQTREMAWLEARDAAIQHALAFAHAGYHKQIVNRLLEPFTHINVVVTATEWDNFFALRRHPDAEPHMRLLAHRIWEAREASTPKRLRVGQWHLPYAMPGDDEPGMYDPDIYDYGLQTLIPKEMIARSVARCARVSYLTHEGRETTIEEDVDLFDRLLKAEPLHASPAEHQATPATIRTLPGDTRNFRGWVPFRAILEGSNASFYA